MLLRLFLRARRIASDQRGTFFVGYSSLVLLVAIAALALITHVAGAPSN